VAPRLLRQVRPLLDGRLVSGDALYCQKALCRQISQAGGDYLFAVKANQPDLLDDVTLLFHDPPPDERFTTASTVGKHGGRLEVRRLRASAALAAYRARRAGKRLVSCWRSRLPWAGRAIPRSPSVRRCATS